MYKPQAGDVIVFPSFYPYFHGVLPIKKSSKYLLRMFYQFEYEGDLEWNNLKKKYGEEEGIRVWKKRQEDWLMSYFDKTEEEIDIMYIKKNPSFEIISKYLSTNYIDEVTVINTRQPTFEDFIAQARLKNHLIFQL